MIGLPELARALDGQVVGQQVAAPGPGHSRRDRSLVVALSPAAPEGIVVHSHAGDDWRACRDHVLDRLGIIPDRDRISLETRTAERPRARAPRSSEPEPERAANGERAAAIWSAAIPPAATPVDYYLVRRGLLLPDQPERALRYHAAVPFAGQSIPGMVALVRNVLTNRAQAIHRTALDAIGRKVAVDGKDRLALGPLAGGAVKLTPDEDVTIALGVAEGIETALSLSALPGLARLPVWSLVSAGGLAAFPVLPGVEALWIAVDRDEAGERAARACAERWRAAGREVLLIRPHEAGADLNDVLTRRKHRG